jgi:phospholipid/cholesterol/gamma-HCH transport system substrate-binding protein
MNEQAMRFRVGLFVLLAMVLLAVLITLFGGVPTSLKRHDRYTIVFDNAPGVAQGTPVRRSGVRIGEVGKVQLDDASGKVFVDVLIERPHPLFRSDVPTLVHGLLSGDTTVDFVAQRKEGVPADLTVVEPGAQLAGATQASVNALINQAADVVPTAQESLNQIRNTLQRYEKMQPLVEETLREYRDLAKLTRETFPDLRRTNEEIQNTAKNWGRLGERLDVLVQTNQDKALKTLDNLNDAITRVAGVFNDENQRNLAATLKNVRTGTDNLPSLSRNTEELVKESLQTVKRVNDSLTTADQVLGNLQQATKPLAERSDRITRNLDESTVRLNGILGDLQELLRAMGTGDGSLRRFLADPSLYNNLNDAACGLVRLMPRVDRMLRDLEVFADKIARHPESLGVGGAINPSSGLKTVPGSSTSWSRPPGH